jgi:hypothetical protein
MDDNNQLLDREYFHGYRDCVLDYVDDDLLTDDMFDKYQAELDDLVFEMFLFNIRCGIATHLVETFLKQFKNQLNDDK